MTWLWFQVFLCPVDTKKTWLWWTSFVAHLWAYLKLFCCFCDTKLTCNMFLIFRLMTSVCHSLIQGIILILMVYVYTFYFFTTVQFYIFACIASFLWELLLLPVWGFYILVCKNVLKGHLLAGYGVSSWISVFLIWMSSIFWTGIDLIRIKANTVLMSNVDPELKQTTISHVTFSCL